MATSNFKSMKDFPLIVHGDIYEKICPECGCGQNDENEKCEICGADMSNAERIHDDYSEQYISDEMQKVADALNEKVSDFFEVTVESGYYSGVQFYVDDKTWKIEEIDNEDAHITYDCCRSEALRRYKVARNTILRGLKKAKEDFGLDEIAVVARFSNGETLYEKVAA